VLRVPSLRGGMLRIAAKLLHVVGCPIAVKVQIVFENWLRDRDSNPEPCGYRSLRPVHKWRSEYAEIC